jgi:hypothetical protein
VVLFGRIDFSGGKFIFYSWQYVHRHDWKINFNCTSRKEIKTSIEVKEIACATYKARSLQELLYLVLKTSRFYIANFFESGLNVFSKHFSSDWFVENEVLHKTDPVLVFAVAQL